MTLGFNELTECWCMLCSVSISTWFQNKQKITQCIEIFLFNPMNCKINGLVQERHNSIAYVFLALTHLNVVCCSCRCPWTLLLGMISECFWHHANIMRTSHDNPICIICLLSWETASQAVLPNRKAIMWIFVECPTNTRAGEINSLRLRQDGHHFADNIFKYFLE